MKSKLPILINAALLLSFVAMSSTLSQSETEAQAVKRYLSGQTILVIHREGGPIYGTHHATHIAFCPSGNYFTKGETFRQTVLGNDEHGSFSDQGRWDVVTLHGLVVVSSISVSGQRTTIPIRMLQNGSLFIGDGISIAREGPAPCR